MSLFTRKSVSVVEAHAAADNGFTLIDVRTAQEWKLDGRAAHARHIPLSALSQRLDRLRDQDVLVICRSGRRSAQAAALLRRHGISARNVRGGMIAWRRHDLPLAGSKGKGQNR